MSSLYNNQPSTTDIDNTVGDSPNVVLGYTMIQRPNNHNTIGGSPQVDVERRIRFYNRTGALNSDKYKFSSFERAVDKIHKWKPKTK